MNKEQIKLFFNKCAPSWDESVIKNKVVINKILDNAEITKGKNVLDVACGTGVLFEEYLFREVNVTGIDLSDEMVKIAKYKFPQIEIICGDIETVKLKKHFDVVMLYNAFPHFPKPERLIQKLSGLVKKGGIVSIAHGMSKEALALHHENAKDVSIDLLDENELAYLMSQYLSVEHIVADENMYQVTGRKV